MRSQPSTRILHFVENLHAGKALACLDERENPPLSTETCAVCSRSLTDESPTAPENQIYKCIDCISARAKCGRCIVRSHAERPFDRIHRWDSSAQTWLRATLAGLGFELRLGHEGQRCPNALPLAKHLKVIHEHGSEDMNVVYCACPPNRARTEQLILAGLWPATWEMPATAISLTALETFHKLKYGAHLTAHDYVEFLKRMTDAVLTHEVPVSAFAAYQCLHVMYWSRQEFYRELNNSMRLYEFVVLCRRSGVDPKILWERAALTVPCPACPLPDYNMRPDWETRSGDDM